MYPTGKDTTDTGGLPILPPKKGNQSSVDTGGLPVIKKKEATPSVSSGGELPSQEDENTPDQYGRTGWLKKLPPPIQLPESKDPLNDALVVAKQQLNSAKAKGGLDGFQESLKASKNIKDITTGKILPNGDVGHELLAKSINGNPDHLSKEQINEVTPNTVTAQAAKKSYLSLRNVKESILHTTNLDDAAIDLAIKNGDKALGKLRDDAGGNTANIGNATKGEKLFELLSNKDFKHLADTDPQIHQEYKEAVFNLPNHYPEFAATFVKQLIANKLEKNGDNNWFYNITGKDKADKIVDDAIANGELPANYKPVYEKEVRPKLDTWKQLVRGNPISTPGLLENASEGAQNMFLGTGKTVAEITGLRNLYKSPTQQLSETVNKDYNTPIVTPEGLLHKTSMHGGQLLGAVGQTFMMGQPLSAGMGLPTEAANALSFGLGIMGDYNDQSKKLFPNKPINQAIYTNVMTGLNIWGAKFLPGQKILQKEEPEIVNTLKGILSGDISIPDGKQQILNKIVETGKGAIGGGEFMAATTAADEILTNALQGKDVDVGHTAEKTWEAFETGFLSTSVLAGSEALLRSNKGLSESLYAMASNPDYFKQVIQEKVPKEQQADILNNLDFAAETKNHLDNETKLSDKQKQRYLAASLREKILTDKSKAISDKSLRGSTEKKIAEVQIEKESILDPEMGSKKFIEEMYDNELLNKGDMRMLEDENGKFDEHKVGEYIKFVAQQSNNLDPNWKPYTGKAPDMTDRYPEQVLEVANERWKKEIERAKTPEEPEATTPKETVNEPVEKEYKAFRYGKEQEGVQFSSRDKDYSEEYATVKGGKPEDVKEVSFKAKNPLVVDLSPKEFANAGAERKYINQAKEQGNDVVVFRSKENNLEFYAQIKQPKETVNETKPIEENDFDKFKNHILEEVANVKDNSFDFRITTGLDQRGIEQAVRNIKEGKDTKAAQQLLASIKEMHDDGYVYMNTSAGGKSQSIQIPIKEYMAEVNKPLKIEDLDELNTLLGEDSFNHTFDNAYDYETKRPTENTETSTTTTGAAGKNIEETPGSKSPPPSDNEVPEAITEGGEGTGIAHAATEEVRKKYNLGEYERANATDAELEQAAEEAIKKGYNPETLVSQMEKGVPPTGTENFILKKYLATLQSQFEKNPTDENLSKIQRLVRATDKIGSLQSEAFRTRKGLAPVEDSRADFFITELAANNDAPLTEGQKKTANEEYEKLNEARKKLDEDTKALEQKFAAFRAEQELGKTKSTTKRSTKKTHEDFVKERLDIISHAKEQLRKARGETTATIIPYAKELIAIAPDVAKMVKSLAEEGIYKLEEVVKNIHSQFKDDIKDLTEKDIHDIIAGEYNEKKNGTKKEAVTIAENLRLEAQLINRLDRLENGAEPKKEKAKVQRNQQIHELRKKIADFRRENPDYEGRLSQLAERNKKETQRIKDKIENGEFEPEAKNIPLLQNPQTKKRFPEAYAKAKAAKDDLIKVKRQIEIRRLKQQYDNMNKYQRFGIGFVKALNVPRTLMASMDFSAPLRQGLVASIAHPVLAARAFKFMIQSAKNERTYNRWLDEVHSSPQWEVAKQAGLAITDPHSLHLKDKEEAFLGSQFAEVVPFVKGSERAYVGYLNKLRWDLFNQYTNAISVKGKTLENSPEMYKAYADFVNSATGRGNLGFVEAASPVLNSILFSPRLIASRFNLLTNWLNPVWYKNTPSKVKAAYVRDMLTFIGVGTGVLMMAKAMGADVEDDPRSSDFGKIKYGDQRWDIWGGFQPYVRLATQLATGQKKSIKTGEIYDMDENKYGRGTRFDALVNFSRGKLAPIPSIGVDLLSKTTGNPREKIEYNFDLNPDNNEVSFTNEAIRHIAPLLGQDVVDAYRGDQGIKAVFTVLPASLLGVGTQNYSEKNEGGNYGGGAGAKGSYHPKHYTPKNKK